MKRYLSKILLWERRSHSISYVGTPFPCVPAPLATPLSSSVHALATLYTYHRESTLRDIRWIRKKKKKKRTKV